MEISIQVPQKLKIKLHNMILLHHSWDVPECKSADNRDNCILVLIAALFTVAKQWDQPSAHQQMNG
jgi:hypothetical protein